jgi:hypothetical protein
MNEYDIEYLPFLYCPSTLQEAIMYEAYLEIKREKNAENKTR